MCGDEFDESLWGRAPGALEQAAARRRMLALYRSQRDQVVAESFTIAQAASWAGVEPATIEALVAAGELLVVETGAGLMIPRWQLRTSESGTRTPIEGVDELARAFGGDVVSLARWMSRPNDEFAGATPASVLAAGRVADVVELARNLTSAGW